ncbi:MAG TPA: glycosyl hydrolase, partial [Chitinophagaceae bacterium]
DLMRMLPFVLYKIVAMGNTAYENRPQSPIDENDPYRNILVYSYGSEHSNEFDREVQRVRYDFELTKAELIRERFVATFLDWCKNNKVQSRVQAYGRGYFPLEGSFDVDIPEGETWIRPGLGTEMQELDYRVGRSYTSMNKMVSSAAHLQGKKLISCEELTNIHRVFNETLELMKIASDQSIISGMTHSVLHGFNYSPPEAPYPGWVIYGTFINERNPWWPYFRQFTDYKARLSALLSNATMFAEMALLPATADLWSIYSAQNDPFPVTMHPRWQTLVWEAIHQNGNACDYISEQVIIDATVKNGYLVFGQRKYHSIFLAQVESLEPAAVKKLFEFVQSGGRVFCIAKFPGKSPGWNDHVERDKEVNDWVNKMRLYTDRCILVDAPLRDYTGWYKNIQEKYNINPYVQIDAPSKYVSQIRYQAKDMEILVFNNSNMNASYQFNITPSNAITGGKQAWLWDAETGQRFKLPAGTISLDFGPSDLKLLVFDKNKKGPAFTAPRKNIVSKVQLSGQWLVTGQHVDGTSFSQQFTELKDLKEIPEWQKFCGIITYRNNFMIDDKSTIEWIDIGKSFGVSELIINGQNAGSKWYGRRIYNVLKLIQNGNNTIEIRVTTTMGNYLKSLASNPVAQFWTNQGNTIQPIQSTGLLGPVIIF